MEIVNIDADTFRTMIERFESFVRRVEDLCERNGNQAMGEWLDNQDVCIMLNISKRTLQTLRDNGKLAFTTIGYKSYYKPEDVEKLITAVSNRKEVKNGSRCKR